MALSLWTKRAALIASVLAASSAAFADSANGDVQSELQALKARINELEAKQNENWLTEERASQIKGLVQEVIADAKTRGQFADGDVAAGYKNGFFIQSTDKNNKLVINGWAKFRYTYGRAENKANNNGNSGITNSDENRDNTSGFEVRNFRVSFAGNVVTPDLTYKIELQADRGSDLKYSDAYVAYKFSDLFNVKTGSYKAPFAKSTLISDTSLGLLTRSEALVPFDASRQIGVSLYGDIIKDTLGYEVAVTNGTSAGGNNGSNTGSVNNFDNRPALYARTQWAGSGTIKDFADESDLRKDNSNFIWMLGGALGYESHNKVREATTTPGWGGVNGSNFQNSAALGDVYRATVDWSAKWQGWSFNTAGYFQQVNQSIRNTNSANATSDSSGFQFGGYGQIGYFIIPQKLEVLGRVSSISSEGPSDSAQFYTIGANYYLAGQNAKISTDITFVPSESAVAGSDGDIYLNNEAFVYRLQFQLKF